MWTIDIYRLDVVEAQLVKIDEISTYQGLQFYNGLNDNGGCQFSLNVYDKKATKENLRRYRNQIAIRRHNDIKFWGPMIKVGGDYEGINGKMLIDSSEYLYHFQDRFTDKLVQYVAQDQEDIAWDLINDTQNKTNGTLLVQRGTNETTQNRNRDYERTSVKTGLVELANVVSGFDFTFDPVVDSNNLVTHTDFNCYYPLLGTVRNDLPTLEIGVNVKRIEFVTSTNLTNSGVIEGQGSGSTIEYPLEYTASQQGYTRRELVLSEKDVSNSSELTLRLQSKLQNDMVEGFNINTELMPGKKPYYTDLNQGDIVNINFVIEGSGGYLDIKKQARIIGISVSIDINGAERVVPKLQILG